MDIKNLTARTGAGIVYVLIILLGILGGGYFFVATFGVFAGLALLEFYRMTEKNISSRISKIFNVVSGVLFFVSAHLYIEGVCHYALPFLLMIYLLVQFASAVLIRRTDDFRSVVYASFGQIYITLPLSLLLHIMHNSYQLQQSNHYIFVIAIFVFIWINDTAAYMVGSLFGKNKLIEHISPNKTVEGFVGGVVLCLVAAVVVFKFYPEFPLWFWLTFALVTSLFGTLGDLFESLIKRRYHKKDSGDVIPGHGGVLDRIDSLLVATPAVYLFLETVKIVGL